MKTVIVSIDLEPDYPPYLKGSHLGVDEAAPRLMDLLRSENVPASIFLLAELCDSHPSLAKDIVAKGFHLGNHGFQHRMLCLEDELAQWHDLSESTRVLHEASGQKVTSFRAPNFSIGGYALGCLEKLGYQLDSSVLPGRRVRKRLSGSVYDFRGAPRFPYHPSKENVGTRGTSTVLEIPAAENPLMPQAPIGGGFLNMNGPAKTIEVIRTLQLPVVVLVLHPWEFVDLHEKFPRLPRWTRSACKDNVPALSEMIGGLKADDYVFSDLQGVATAYENRSHEDNRVV